MAALSGVSPSSSQKCAKLATNTSPEPIFHTCDVTKEGMWCDWPSWNSRAPAGPILMMTISAFCDFDSARAKSAALNSSLPCSASASLLFRTSASRSALEPFS
ncbi:hypothetical protein D3C84_1036110 [compost metagenome]